MMLLNLQTVSSKKTKNVVSSLAGLREARTKGHVPERKPNKQQKEIAEAVLSGRKASSQNLPKILR